MHKVVSIRFEETARPRDLLWRPASVEVRDGPEGVVYIPATYPTTPTGPEATALRLGRATDWQGAEGEVVRGVGLRLFVVGEDGVGIDELSEVDFETASA
jgi:type VI secretion system protein ImpE